MNIHKVTVSPPGKFLFINLNVSSRQSQSSFLVGSGAQHSPLLSVQGGSTMAQPTGFPALDGHVPWEPAAAPGLR